MNTWEKRKSDTLVKNSYMRYVNLFQTWKGVWCFWQWKQAKSHATPEDKVLKLHFVFLMICNPLPICEKVRLQDQVGQKLPKSMRGGRYISNVKYRRQVPPTESLLVSALPVVYYQLHKIRHNLILSQIETCIVVKLPYSLYLAPPVICASPLIWDQK